jgi:hypothetical protein
VSAGDHLRDTLVKGMERLVLDGLISNTPLRPDHTSERINATLRRR